jgi:hypothetical protein
MMVDINTKFDQLCAKIDEMKQRNTEEHEVVCAKLGRMNTALFAKDDDNEFKMTGLMVIGQRIDSHIDTVCAMGRYLRHAIVWLGSIASGVSAIWFLGFQLGWW